MSVDLTKVSELVLSTTEPTPTTNSTRQLSPTYATRPKWSELTATDELRLQNLPLRAEMINIKIVGTYAGLGIPTRPIARDK